MFQKHATHMFKTGRGQVAHLSKNLGAAANIINRGTKTLKNVSNELLSNPDIAKIPFASRAGEKVNKLITGAGILSKGLSQASEFTDLNKNYQQEQKGDFSNQLEKAKGIRDTAKELYNFFN